MTGGNRKKWMKKYETVLLVKEVYPDFNVKGSDKKFVLMKDWIRKQRRWCLEDWQKELLNKIGFFDNVESMEENAY